MGNAKNSFFHLVHHPLKFRLFLLSRLPSAYFSGVRVVHADERSCSVSVSYKWFSRNPFRSTYFACLSMAAEMSTGVLAMAQVYNRQPAVSMLVTGVNGQFYKKATGTTIFTCVQGIDIREAVEKAIATGEGQTITALAEGRDAGNERIAAFQITWSFKRKRS